MTANYDLQRAAALWRVDDGAGEHVARCLHQAAREHARHLPCDQFMCVQGRTIELAYEPFEDDGMGSAGAAFGAYCNALIPMLDDFWEQVRESKETRA